MKLQKVRWGDGSISSCPKYLVDAIRNIDPKLSVLGEREVSSGKINLMEKEIPEDWMPVRANYKPVPFLNTQHVNALECKDQWLEVRRKGIGGSESATARGFGKYQSIQSLYWDKTNDPQYQPMDESSNWEILEYGHLLEPWVRKVFSAKVQKKTIEVPMMYQHPLFPFMLADIDGVVLDENEIAGFEAKTTNPNNLREWKNNSIPPHYVAQMQHYMAVMNFRVYYIACAYGNTRNDIFIRKIYRDFECEEQMILDEGRFWKCVETRQEPPVSIGQNIPAAYREYMHRKRRRPFMDLPYDSNMIFIEHMADLEAKKKELSSQSKEVEKELMYLKLLFLQQMREDNGFLASGAQIHDEEHKIGYYLQIKETEGKDVITAQNQEILKMDHPEIFEKYATRSKDCVGVKLRTKALS